MHAKLLKARTTKLDAFLQRFESFFPRQETVEHFRGYVRGLLSDLPRKTPEPLARQSGTSARCLQNFLRVDDWNQEKLVDAVQQTLRTMILGVPPLDESIAVLMESSVLKKGIKTPGTQRQYLGCIGKSANGVVAEHLAVAHESFQALLDSELFLPQTWSRDRPRCREASIPEGVCHRPHGTLALDLVPRAQSNGWRFGWLVLDLAFSRTPDFLSIWRQSEARSPWMVGEVSEALLCWPEECSQPVHLADLAQRPEVLNRPARQIRSGRGVWQESWQVKTLEVALEDCSLLRYRLILARNDQTTERRSWITSASRSIDTACVLRAALMGRSVQRCFEKVHKTIGLHHWEGRNYLSLRRHWTLCLVALAFLSIHHYRERIEHRPGT